MLRIIAKRPLLKGLTNGPSMKASYRVAIAASKSNVRSEIRSLSPNRPRIIAPAAFRPATIPLLRYAIASPFDKIDREAKRRYSKKKIEAHPEEVTPASPIRNFFEEIQTELDDNSDADMLRGIKSDIETIKKTFALNEVPQESYYFGLAGVLPYLATSLSTVYLAYDISHAQSAGFEVLFSEGTARQLLSVIEPIQIGYGAVIISFLGAIHWGLEYAGYGRHHGYRRYAIGVIAAAVAWPTMLMPIEYALISQFMIFNFLYFADASATTRGWAPPWYSSYRFVLTFIVGASLVVSLIGRGQIVQKETATHRPPDMVHLLREDNWKAIEALEKERLKRITERGAAKGERDEEDKHGDVDEDGENE